METHRYVRSCLSKNSWDIYNGLATDRSNSNLEYWTNGRTTLVTTAQSPESAKTPLLHAPGGPYIHTTSHTATMPTSNKRPLPTTSIGSSSPPPETSSNNVLVRNSLLAGSVAGMASTAVMYPMDVIRTKMQSSAIVVGTAGQQHSHHAAASQTPVQVLRHTLQHGGVRALYTGLTLPLLAQAIYKGTVFTVNNLVLERICEYKTWENNKQGILEDHRLTMGNRFVAGCCGGAINAVLFVTPVEFIRNQLIAQHSKLAAAGQDAGGRLALAAAPKSATTTTTGRWQDVVVQTVRHHGLSSLWRGASMTVARDAIGCGCFFYAMNWTQARFTPPNEKPSFGVTVASGGVAGLAFWLAILPLDSVKTLIQSADLTERASATESIRRVYNQAGAQGLLHQLFRGWQVAYGRGVPAAAITISVYSYIYAHLQQ